MYFMYSTRYRSAKAISKETKCWYQAVSLQDGLPVIRIPVKMREKILDKQHKDKKLEKTSKITKVRQGDLSSPIITAKNSSLNFFKGQTYGKFDTVPLASGRWASRKSVGDYFTIHKHVNLPGLLITGEDETFSSLGLHDTVVAQMHKCGYTVPTNIQALTIPKVLKGSNCVIASETGNGKTLAFLAPIIDLILKQKDLEEVSSVVNAPKALVIVPGRELAWQTWDIARKIGRDIGIDPIAITGGRTKKMMTNPRMSRHDILIGSLGALSKLFTTGVYKSHCLKHIVLDEADSLMDDSFNEQAIHFLSKFPFQAKDQDNKDKELSGLQLILVGATFPTSLKSILKPIAEMESFEIIRTSLLHRLNPYITQHFIRLAAAQKAEKLLSLGKNNFKNRVPTIIFSNKSNTADWISLFLIENGVPCLNFHGNMTALLRKGRFDSFQDGEVFMMSCTDLASRGLNTVRAEHIINFQFPTFMSDYIHRIGRTGRTGAKGGFVTNFIQEPYEVELLQRIEYSLRKNVDLPNVNANIKRKLVSRYEKQAPTSAEIETY